MALKTAKVENDGLVEGSSVSSVPEMRLLCVYVKVRLK